jgi:predicted chitinase
MWDSAKSQLGYSTTKKAIHFFCQAFHSSNAFLRITESLVVLNEGSKGKQEKFYN